MSPRILGATAVAIAGALLALGAPAATPARPSLPIARVSVANPQQAAYVAGHFDETHALVDGAVEVVLWPGDGARLRGAGFSYTLLRDLLTDPREQPTPADAPIALPGPDRSDYRRLVDYERELFALSQSHPTLARHITLRERTLEGRAVYGVEIAANVAAVDGRPTFWVDGIHHAREWPAAEYPMLFAHYLVEGFGRDREVTDLLRKLRVVIVPVMNPDGFSYSRDGLDDGGRNLLAATGQQAYWRKNRRSRTGVTVPHVQRNPDAYGVDPNRNYGFMWGDNEGGSSSDTTSETHRGSAPFSEPESRNVANWQSTHNVVGVITNHTSGRLVMHPWGYTDGDTSDEKYYEDLGERMSEALDGYRNIKAIELYLTSGGSRDWAYGALGALTYTFEHGEFFHPPYAGQIGEFHPNVIRAFLIAAHTAADARHHSVVNGRVVDARTGRPVRADLRLSKTVTSPLWPGNPSGEESNTRLVDIPTATDASGRFSWHVNPSARPWVGAAGAREAYTLHIVTDGRSTTRRVFLSRGAQLNLGVIRV